jgi:hypothetical protein
MLQAEAAKNRYKKNKGGGGGAAAGGGSPPGSPTLSGLSGASSPGILKSGAGGGKGVQFRGSNVH